MDLSTAYRYNQNMMEYYTCKYIILIYSMTKLCTYVQQQTPPLESLAYPIVQAKNKKNLL